MKIAALISGGKDSIFSIMHCKSLGHEVLVLGNLFPVESKEIDSWMYQSIGSELIPLIAECIGLPLVRRAILGKSVVVSGDYKETKEDEVEDLFELLSDIKRKFPDIEGVCCGAILSSYQRVRVENVCSRLGLVAIAPLWMQNQNNLLQDMISSKVGAVIVKTAAIGLDESDLGKSLSTLYPKLLKLHQLYDLHICGEGGEYETFTLDAPFFLKRIKVIEKEIIQHSDGVWYLIIKKATVVEKNDCDNDWRTEFQRIIKERYLSFSEELDEYEDFPKNDDICLKRAYTVPSNASSFEITISAIHDTYIAVSGLSVENSGSIYDDTEKIMRSLGTLLKQNNSSLQNAIQVTIYLNDMSKFSDLNRAYSSFVSPNSPPTRVTVQACISGSVQIDILSYIDKSEESKPISLYVQGISYWAPANIGPYSQAIQFGNTTWFSGMIGLVPSSMKLPPPSLQGRQSINNVKRVAEAMNTDLNNFALSCVCYITAVEKDAASFWKENSDILCLIVEVPCLPKNAVIEWQVVAFSVNGFKKSLQNHPDIDPSCFINPPERKITDCSFSQGDLSGIIQKVSQGDSCFVTGWSDSLMPTSSLELLSSLIKKVISLQKQESIVSIRIFFPSKSPFSEADQNCITELISNCAFTFVPVEKVMGKNAAVGISVFIKKEYQDLAQIVQTD